ncbi:MAG: nucleotidyl transferase AbiEii/AbiGii toxin family protein [Acidobacteria bacterium]|nr:MAG: nucleotidyl transferase AbiEii/AbiGii toxin family protein [Acidobacteriota bacterium]
MRYATAAAFRQALHQRLKNEAEGRGLSLVRLRKRAAFELFLRRLVQVAPGRWVLKGALALDLRLDAGGRFTRDIDLGRDDDEQAAIEDITAAEQLQLDDFFTFSARRDSEFADTDEFSAVRFHITAQLAGRTFDQFVLDVGFTDAIAWTPDTIETSGLLTFAGIEPIEVPAVPILVHLAEKVHAYTRVYGEDERRCTRPKDLVDILLIAAAGPVDAGGFRDALDRTFTGRGRQELPAELPPPPESWADKYGDLAREVAVEPDLGRAFELAVGFVDPVLAGGNAGGRWDPPSWEWR